MYGAILGDICGSIFERYNCKTENPQEIDLINERCRFTDDTVMTIATATAILGDGNYQQQYLNWGRGFLHAGYGGTFRRWLEAENPRPYNS
jgi:ADP-ribosylglycohydrolase